MCHTVINEDDHLWPASIATAYVEHIGDGGVQGIEAIASAPTPAAAAPTPEVVLPASEPVRTVQVPAKPRVEKPPAAVAAALKPALESNRPRAEPVAKPPPVASPETTVSAGPGPECGAREGIRYHVCMERECARSDFFSHSSCQRWRQDARKE